MSATTSLLNVCPNLQGDLDANWLNCHSRVQSVPFLEYLLSGDNKQPVSMQIIPGNGKVRKFEVRYQQRKSTSTVSSNQPITTCSGKDKVGDLLTTYDIDTNQNRQTGFSFDWQDFIRNCQDTREWLAQQFERELDVLRRAVWTKEAAAMAALTGGWGDYTEAALTVVANRLRVKTLKDASTDVFPTTWEEIDQALMMAGFCDQVVMFGSSKLWNYTRKVQAGCCSSQGIDLRAIYQSYNRAMIWDPEVETALGDSDNAVAVQRGALQLLNFSLFQGYPNGMNIGSNYSNQVIQDPLTGMLVDVVMSDNCGTVNVAMTATTKLIALPTDMFAAGDVYSGVNYLAQVEVANV